MICPHCHRTIREEKRYLMSVDPEKPGVVESLQGQAGEAWRIFVTVGVCLLFVLMVTGGLVAVQRGL